MAKYQICCAKCGTKLAFTDKLIGRSYTCTKCGHKMTLVPEGQVGESAPAQPAQPAQPASAAPPRPSSPPAFRAQPSASNAASAYPERMKANKSLAGKACETCQRPIELGDEVYNCPRCRKTQHLPCYETTGGCPSCSASAVGGPAPGTPPFGGPPRPPRPAQVYHAEAGEESTDRTPCRFCGEMIASNARKCRFCGEFLNEIDRIQEKKRVQSASGDDYDLSTTEVVFGLLCGGIACIVAIVYLIQNKPKGWKLLGISFLSQIFWGLVRVMIGGGY